MTTVKELIESLSKYPEDMVVVIQPECDCIDEERGCYTIPRILNDNAPAIQLATGFAMSNHEGDYCLDGCDCHEYIDMFISENPKFYRETNTSFKRTVLVLSDNEFKYPWGESEQDDK